jgi:hypothetical protein
VKRIKTFLEKLRNTALAGWVGLTTFCVTGGAAYAQSNNTLQLNNLSGSTGAGSNDLTSLSTKGQNVMQSGVNFVLIFFAAVGVSMVGASLWAIHKANKDQRESPKTAVVGLFVGGAMTCVALIVGYIRNTYNAS